MNWRLKYLRKKWLPILKGDCITQKDADDFKKNINEFYYYKIRNYETEI